MTAGGRLAWLAVVLLCRCATELPVPPVSPAVSAAAVPATAPAAASAAPVTAVKQAYHAAARRELPKVLADDVSAERVTRIHSADILAREALGRLEAQGRHYTADALAEARFAVRQLISVLGD
jgi:hypothetical protein